MEENGNIKEVIAILEESKKQISELLESNPTLQLRVTSTFDRLSNGLKVVIGEPISDNTQEGFKMEKLESVFGRKIHEKKELKVQKTDKKEVDLLRETAAVLYDTFPEQQSKELIERLTDMEVRAVAKLAGLQVTSTQPAKITVVFIEKIKEAIVNQKELKAAQEAELAKSDKV
jgi:hypothetical protein